MPFVRCALTGWLLLLASTVHAEGKLDRARDAVRGSGSSASGGRDRDRDDDDCGFLCALVTSLVSGADDDCDEDESDAPYDGPYGAQPYESQRSDFGFAPYPYARPDAHYLVPRDLQLAAFTSDARASDVATAPLPRPPRGWAGQLALDAGHLDGVTRSGLFGRVMMPGGFELDARYALMLEPSSDDGLDHASTGSAHVTYRVLGAHMLLLRLGAGLRYWADAELGDAGVDLLLGLDVFPLKPFVFSAHVAGGSLGEAFATDARVQVGVALERFEMLAGFEWLRIDTVDLSMPVVGTRLWL